MREIIQRTRHLWHWVGKAACVKVLMCKHAYLFNCRCPHGTKAKVGRWASWPFSICGPFSPPRTYQLSCVPWETHLSIAFVTWAKSSLKFWCVKCWLSPHIRNLNFILQASDISNCVPQTTWIREGGNETERWGQRANKCCLGSHLGAPQAAVCAHCCFQMRLQRQNLPEMKEGVGEVREEERKKGGRKDALEIWKHTIWKVLYGIVKWSWLWFRKSLLSIRLYNEMEGVKLRKDDQWGCYWNTPGKRWWDPI